MKTKFKSPKFTVQLLVALSMLIAVRYIVGKFTLDIIPKQLEVGPSFIVNSVMGAISGPVISFFTFIVYDIVTYLLGGGAAFNIFWSLMEGLQGLLYGYFFYGKALDINKKRDWLHTTIAVTTIMVVGTFILTPLLMQIFYGTPILAQFLAGRWLKIFEIPIRVLVTMLVLPQLQRIPELRKLMGLK